MINQVHAVLPVSLQLTRAQAGRLHAYLQRYRHVLLTTRLSCPQRNQRVRIVQSVQGRLIKTLDQSTSLSHLLLAHEEVATLHILAAELLLLYAQEPPSEQREATLTDLAALKVHLKRCEAGALER